jgi:transposase
MASATRRLPRVADGIYNQVSRLTIIWVDGGFDGKPFMQWVMDFCRWIVQVVLRPEQTKGFAVLKKRWVVERTFGWLMGTRRLVSRC